MDEMKGPETEETLTGPSRFAEVRLLYEMHNKEQDRFVYTCIRCKIQVESRYHCTECEDFDMCVECFKKDRHHHKMEKLGISNPQKSRKFSVLRCLMSIGHICRCRDDNCVLRYCPKMRRVVSHPRECKIENKLQCKDCKCFVTMSTLHVKNCEDDKCWLPFCNIIKRKYDPPPAKGTRTAS